MVFWGRSRIQAEIDNRRLAVVWDDKDGGCLLTADNLQRWAEDAKTLLDRLPEDCRCLSRVAAVSVVRLRSS